MSSVKFRSNVITGYTGPQQQFPLFHLDTKLTILGYIAQLITHELGFDVRVEGRLTSRGTREYTFSTESHGSVNVIDGDFENILAVGHLKLLKREIIEGLDKNSTKLKSLLDGI